MSKSIVARGAQSEHHHPDVHGATGTPSPRLPPHMQTDSRRGPGKLFKGEAQGLREAPSTVSVGATDYLSELLDVVSPNEWRKCVRRIMELAQSGNVPAFRAIADYCVGKPAPYVRGQGALQPVELAVWRQKVAARVAAVAELEE